MLERPFLLRYVVASNQSHRKILIRTLVVTLVLLSTSCGDSSNQEDLLNQALERGLDPNIYIGRSKRFELSVMSLGKVDTPVRRRKYFSSGASKAT